MRGVHQASIAGQRVVPALPCNPFLQLRRPLRVHAVPPAHPSSPSSLPAPPAVALALHERAMLPAIWFIFSRRECDLAARHLDMHVVSLTSAEGECRSLF